MSPTRLRGATHGGRDHELIQRVVQRITKRHTAIGEPKAIVRQTITTDAPTRKRRGPKVAVDPSPLPFDAEGNPSQRFSQFCERYLILPRGHGVGTPMVLRPWQRQMMGRVMDPDPRPSIAGIMMPRGQGKSQLMAAWTLFELFTGLDGNQIVIVASSERQAHLVVRLSFG